MTRNSRFRSVRTAKPERNGINLTALLFAGIFVAVVFGLKALFGLAALAIQNHAH